VTATLESVGTSLVQGTRFPDLELPDHTGRERRLSEVAGGDPLVLLTSRGWWCPKEQRYLRDALAWWIPLLGDSLVCLTTLAVDSVNYGGAVTVATEPAVFADDPFARIFPGTTVRTSLFSRVPAPVGPVEERYSGAAWPGGAFKNVEAAP
jgi:hypothetical protein